MGQDIKFRNLALGQGSFSGFPAAPPCMIVHQIPLGFAVYRYCIIAISFLFQIEIDIEPNDKVS